MNKDSFWIFVNLGLGDAIVSNAIFRHYAKLHEDKLVVIPCWEHNLASIQWMLSDVPNIFFYPIETEQHLMQCRDSLQSYQALCLGFYETDFDRKERWRLLNDFKTKPMSSSDYLKQDAAFNPVLWDSEFYRQAGLDPELKWSGFKLPELFSKSFEPHDESAFSMDGERKLRPYIVCHQDEERGFSMKSHDENCIFIDKQWSLKATSRLISLADEIHCIDSSMLNLADLMETPHCKRFVFHRYARKGLPPQLRKPWEIIQLMKNKER